MTRGPKPKGYIPLKTDIPPELHRALDQFVAATGVSRASLVRIALANELVRLNLIPSNFPTTIAVSATRGPSASQK